jgi:uncharacterized membrane protein YbaN (DUF454 family)
LKNIALNVVGCIALLLGVLGIFLPLLPTTPFLLLASACFARGSTRMHGWLINNRHFGPYVRDFEQGKGIPLKGKAVAVTLMWLSMAYAFFRLGDASLKWLLPALAIGVSVYLIRFVPTRKLNAPEAPQSKD